MGHSSDWATRSAPLEERFPLRGAACVAEPEEGERKRLARVLRRMGYNVHETGSGEAARFIAAQVHLEVLALNLLLRDVRVLTLIRQLRRAQPGLRIIAFAPARFDAPPVGLELARVAGADAALQAPVSAGALARAITEARRASDSGVSQVTAAESAPW